MRSYANFLLFEDVLTNLPAGSPLILTAANTLMNPFISIVETDCGTLLGSVVTLDYSQEGQTELATNTPLSIARISSLMAQGVKTIHIRNISTCVSKGGICRTCYDASTARLSLLDGTWPLDGSRYLNGHDHISLPGDIIQLSSEFIYMTQIFIGDGVNASYPVSQTSADYTKTNITGGGYPEVVSLTDTTITFATIRTSNDIFSLHYYKISSDPFLEYIAKSYSGALLGLAPLPSYQLLLKPSVYETMFSESQIHMLRMELDRWSSNIPPSFLAYCDTITDTLEKILFIIYLYAIYANVL